jgi:diaminopimelate epimerase
MIKPSILEDGTVKVDMGFAILDPKLIPCKLEANFQTPDTDQKAVKGHIDVFGDMGTTEIIAISMGNPHCITFVDDVDKVDLARDGPMFEKNPVFPQKTNTEFVQVINRNEVKMVVWERGAGATLACGTGTCALALASYITGKTDK